ITGVSSIDTQVVNHLIKTIQAARLLGAECVITGIRPEIAQTMIHLGLDMESFPTRRSLRDGLMYALEKLGYRVVRPKESRNDTARRNTGTQDRRFPDHLDPGIASR
ncbi:STAS domain-containing protein, partial [Dehalococcoidia bacterium]|nr:STAS domain-containing protein [Dehalococcoidia bacterium]